MLIADEKAGAGAVVGQLGSGALGSVRGHDLGRIDTLCFRCGES